jgi:outer membrane protein OmpA-like peptidoglycan-associated protein
MVRKVVFFLIASLLCQLVDGQNLVANPSFEDVNICSEYHQPCSPSAWWFVNRKVTSGFFPRYPSATGQRHLQIVAASRETTNRQYWETMLLCPLQAGEKYIIDLKVASFKEHPNLRDIGFWFNDRFVFSKLDTLLQPRTFLRFTDAKMKDLKNGWFEISKEFTPSRNASFLIIGNFNGLSNADILDQRQKPQGSIEIGVDDIVITAVKAPLCSGYKKIKDSLYSITRRHSDAGSGEPGDDTDTVPPARDTAARTIPSPVTKTDTLIIHNIQFGFDRYLVDNPDTLLRYKKFLTQSDIKKIRVVGFTDDKGTESYNQRLSEKRAQEVARLLTTRFGIQASLIESEGRGISHDFKDSNLNRRVEIYIFH